MIQVTHKWMWNEIKELNQLEKMDTINEDPSSADADVEPGWDMLSHHSIALDQHAIVYLSNIRSKQDDLAFKVGAACEYLSVL